jgi:hypothetical protein
MTSESMEDLTKLLKEMGYSTNATNEILKWYKDDKPNRRT